MENNTHTARKCFHTTPSPPVILRPFFGRRIPTLFHARCCWRTTMLIVVSHPSHYRQTMKKAAWPHTPTHSLTPWGFFGTKYVPQNDRGMLRWPMGTGTRVYIVIGVREAGKHFRFATPSPPVILRPFFGRRIPTLFNVRCC